MKHSAIILQILFLFIALYAGFVRTKNKNEKNTWGREQQSIFDIFSTRNNSNRIRVKTKLRAKIELHAYDLYIYARNNGNVVAKNVILHSNGIEPMDVTCDEKGLDIQPGEEINYFVNSFEDKKITKVTVSWTDEMGYHKRPFLVKQKSSIS
ncbi:MAG: hypothetical protein KAH01_01750 [Caldisericia bacterium]|nr:hypothetical protein [Caldisericia bacterium]